MNRINGQACSIVIILDLYRMHGGIWGPDLFEYNVCVYHIQAACGVSTDSLWNSLCRYDINSILITGCCGFTCLHIGVHLDLKRIEIEGIYYATANISLKMLVSK